MSLLNQLGKRAIQNLRPCHTSNEATNELEGLRVGEEPREACPHEASPGLLLTLGGAANGSSSCLQSHKVKMVLWSECLLIQPLGKFLPFLIKLSFSLLHF